MLVRITPDQVSKGWEIFGPMIMESMPDEGEVAKLIETNILAGILREEGQVWVYETDEAYKAVILTTIHDERLLGIRHLIIFALYRVENMSPKEWKEGLESLHRYKDSIGASSILGYYHTDDIKYKRFLQSLGGDASTSIIRF
jgi:hypothetical protein